MNWQRHDWQWLYVLPVIIVVVGTASAAFGLALARVTAFRLADGWLLWLLPVGGVLLGWLYTRYGQSSAAGNKLLIRAIHNPTETYIPRRMSILIVLSTLLTHLLGGSAGREGTAVQMGGALAASIGRFNLNTTQQRTILQMGIAAGFGGVFGTPFTATVFALEVPGWGGWQLASVLPCLLAALGSDWVARAWGNTHSHYSIASPIAIFDGVLAAKVLLAAVAFGAVSIVFSESLHLAQKYFAKCIPNPLLRPFIGGCIIIALVYALGSRDYLGLGTTAIDPHAITLAAALRPGGVTPWSWLLKLLFTVITLSSGFKGGEVTPLFFIGATLGQVLARLLAAPVDLFAGLGFVAVFAAAAHTPLACSILAIELFGWGGLPYFALACFVARFVSQRSGIYK